jgi:diadenosine tetraphosphate (Ap4A) HIT family hydrolase
MQDRYEMDWDAYHKRARAGPCFICRIIARDPEFSAHIVYEDEHAIAFLDRYPRGAGYTLIAPRRHREQVTSDFTTEQYLQLQQRLHRVAEAVRQELRAERLYLLSLGSNQGNAHVHWHIVPLAPGTPYEQQQLEIYRLGVLRMSDAEQAALAERLRLRIAAAGEAAERT